MFVAPVEPSSFLARSVVGENVRIAAAQALPLQTSIDAMSANTKSEERSRRRREDSMR